MINDLPTVFEVVSEAVKNRKDHVNGSKSKSSVKIVRP